MGSDPSAEIFFGITKWVPSDTANEIEEKFRARGNVEIGRCPAGFDGGDNELVAAKWKPSMIKGGIDYDHKFTMPVIDVSTATSELVATWKALGLKLETPTWHLVASYG